MTFFNSFFYLYLLAYLPKRKNSFILSMTFMPCLLRINIKITANARTNNAMTHAMTSRSTPFFPFLLLLPPLYRIQPQCFLTLKIYLIYGMENLAFNF